MYYSGQYFIEFRSLTWELKIPLGEIKTLYWNNPEFTAYYVNSNSNPGALEFYKYCSNRGGMEGFEYFSARIVQNDKCFCFMDYVVPLSVELIQSADEVFDMKIVVAFQHCEFFIS